MRRMTWPRWRQRIPKVEFAWLCTNGLLLVGGFILERTVTPHLIGSITIIIGMASNVVLIARWWWRLKAEAFRS